MEFEPTIGLEVHIQLLTDSKIFCSCSTKFGLLPNENVCPICMGMPGVLPVLNKKVVEFAVKLGLALNCNINKYSVMARKNYFYPDLPKNYQISQYELPILTGGYVEIEDENGFTKIPLERIHIEEDAGKTIHTHDSSLVDFNRTGVPLLEIVSKPAISTPRQAYEYLRSLRRIVRYLGICDGNMEEGSLRCDANISIKPKGQTELGTKVEIKNMNSFKHVEKALEYEIERQIQIVMDNKEIVQETRLFDEKTFTTKPMRSKEEAYEYRYFPDPDLVPIVIEDNFLELIKSDLPELPLQKFNRFIKTYNIKEEDAKTLIESKELADFYEEVAKKSNPKSALSWVLTETLGYLNKDNKDITQLLIKPDDLAELINLVENNVISGKIAKEVFAKMYETGLSPKIIIEKENLTLIQDTGIIEKALDEAIANNPKAVEQYKAGKKNTIGFFVGAVMKATKGKADPKIVNELIIKKLGEI
ncbi:aspartyl/glutamyl-tRNA(Asn/Gln) amidotransferase subunit B [Desulfurella multipotens]|uniref:Aspartyl/glutamyl-tRNA(Asn/Gln) amidotransferase subunit B n=1 Tax=Desulfurella multipotens TaxID=79269 RepID=A0A1G6J5L1_9BACT|nr:Asp-tRNA(Asn)/Glu-tRNA(Gln) amidotransferase subunit GatB [Desulfurella multipotens]SDC13937.1 aspartyl/glutamyl-tRNA(Asn/Gln) amidotransferase subunit B [Desulfurella multipotens]